MDARSDTPHPGRPTTGTTPDRADLELLVCALVASGMVLLAVAETDWVVRLAGAELAVGSAAYGYIRLSSPQERGARALAAIGTVLGVALAASPEQARDALAVVVGIAFVVLGLWFILRDVDDQGGVRRVLTVGALFVPVGAAMLVLANSALSAGLWVGAAVIGAYGSLRLGQRLGVTRVPVTGRQPLLLAWVSSKGPRPDDARDVADQLFFEGPAAFSRTARFALLMLFASVISAVGVLTDSTALVIGAMLIAPLISPMMGMGLSLAMGWPGRLARSTSLVVSGIVIAIGTGWLLATALDLAVDLQANTQIVSRSSPTIADLVVAVAAGAAGAYALSRKDVSSSLPGVAVAIALVPPLSVVGIAAQQGDWAQASGTALLFLTNLTAILLVGGGVFVLTGIAPLPRVMHDQHRVAVALGVTAVAAVFVVAALVLNSAAIVRNSLDVDDTRRSVERWLGPDSELTLVSVDVQNPDVTIVLAGTGRPPSAQDLATSLASDLGHEVSLDLQWIPRRRELVRSGAEP